MANNNQNEMAAMLISRWQKLKADRATWDNHYQELANFCLPRKNNITTTPTPGEKKTSELFDSTAIRAAERFASGLYNYMSPPSKNWFMLSPPDEYAQDGDYKDILSEVTTITHEQIAISNFGLEIYENYLDLGIFGTGNLYVDKGSDKALNFSNRHIGEYVCLENNKGLIDTVIRKFDMTARQAVQEFGKENVSEEIRQCVNGDAKQKDKKFEFLHVVQPRTDRDTTKRDSVNYPVASFYIEMKSKKTVTESGYKRMRYLVSRFMKSSFEIMGRSPGMMLLPDVKMLNKMCELLIIGAEKAINPPILAPDDGFMGTVRTTPNSIIYYRATLPQQSKPEPFNSGARVDIGLEMINQQRDIVKDGFYNDLFLILSDDKERTATEVLEIAQEKLHLLGPNFGRLKTELFDPMVEISVELLAEQGRLPALPQGQTYYEIEYISKLALAMKYAQINSTTNALARVSPLAEIDPSVWDNYNLDEISRGIGEYMGVPKNWLRSVDEIRDIREQRKEQQAIQQAAAEAMAAAEAAPKLQKKTEQGSPLDEIGNMLNAA